MFSFSVLPYLDLKDLHDFKGYLYLKAKKLKRVSVLGGRFNYKPFRSVF